MRNTNSMVYCLKHHIKGYGHNTGSSVCCIAHVQCWSDLLYRDEHQLTSLYGLMDFSLMLHSLVCITVLFTLWDLSLQLFKVFHTEVGVANFEFTPASCGDV